MAFEDPFAAWFDDARPVPRSAVAEAEPPNALAIGVAQAMTTALGRYPAAVLTGIDLSNGGPLWFRVVLRQPGELRRVSGRTIVYVSSRCGRELQEYDARIVPIKTKF